MPDIDRAIRDRLDAWDRDDLDRLARLLAAEAEQVWDEPGAWDSHVSASQLSSPTPRSPCGRKAFSSKSMSRSIATKPTKQTSPRVQA
jgi:hypothetical protein